MSAFISAVLSHADKLPLVGAPISSATAIFLANSGQWGHLDKNSAETLSQQGEAVSYRLSTKSTPVAVNPPPSSPPPPPPYDCGHAATLPKSSDLVWKQSSFGSTGAAPLKNGMSLTLPGQAPTLDKRQVEHAVTMINMATEMDNAGNHTMAMELYMMGLDRIIDALPLDTDAAVRKSFEDKIKQFKDLKKLDLGLSEIRAQYAMALTQADGKKPVSDISFSELVVQAVVLGAVMLKKSPLPVLFESTMACARSGLLTVDQICQLRKRALGIASFGITKAMWFEQRFEIHQTLSEVVFTFYTALTKAGIAYAETPGYNQQAELAAAERMMTTTRGRVSTIPVM